LVHPHAVGGVVDRPRNPDVPGADDAGVDRARVGHPGGTLHGVGVHLPGPRGGGDGRERKGAEQGGAEQIAMHGLSRNERDQAGRASPPRNARAGAGRPWTRKASSAASSGATTWIKWPPSSCTATHTTSPSGAPSASCTESPGATAASVHSRRRPRLALPRKWVRATISWPG